MSKNFFKLDKGYTPYTVFLDTVNETIDNVRKKEKQTDDIIKEINNFNKKVSELEINYSVNTKTADFYANSLYHQLIDLKKYPRTLSSMNTFNKEWNNTYVKVETILSEIMKRDDIHYRINGFKDNSTNHNIDKYGTVKIRVKGDGRIIRETISSSKVISNLGCNINGEKIYAFHEIIYDCFTVDEVGSEGTPSGQRTEIKLMMLKNPTSTEWVDAPSDIYYNNQLVGSINELHTSTEKSDYNNCPYLDVNTKDIKFYTKINLNPEDGNINSLYKDYLAFKTGHDDCLICVFFNGSSSEGVSILKLDPTHNVWLLINPKNNKIIFDWLYPDNTRQLYVDAFPADGEDKARGNAFLTGESYMPKTTNPFKKSPFNSLNLDEIKVFEDENTITYAIFLGYGLQKTESVFTPTDYEIQGNTLVTLRNGNFRNSSKKIVLTKYKVYKKNKGYDRITDEDYNQVLDIDLYGFDPNQDDNGYRTFNQAMYSHNYLLAPCRPEYGDHEIPYFIHDYMGGEGVPDPISMVFLDNIHMLVIYENGSLKPLISYDVVAYPTWGYYPGCGIPQFEDKSLYHGYKLCGTRVDTTYSATDGHGRHISLNSVVIGGSIKKYDHSLHGYQDTTPSDTEHESLKVMDPIGNSRYPYGFYSSYNGACYSHLAGIKRGKHLGDINIIHPYLFLDPNQRGLFPSKYTDWSKTTLTEIPDYSLLPNSMFLTDGDSNKPHSIVPCGKLSMNALSFTFTSQSNSVSAPSYYGTSRDGVGMIYVPFVVVEYSEDKFALEGEPTKEVFIALTSLIQLTNDSNLRQGLHNNVFSSDTNSEGYHNDYRNRRASKKQMSTIIGNTKSTMEELGFEDIIFRISGNKFGRKIANPPTVSPDFLTSFDYADDRDTHVDSVYSSMNYGAKKYIPSDNYNCYRQEIEPSSSIKFECVILDKEGKVKVYKIDEFESNFVPYAGLSYSALSHLREPIGWSFNGGRFNMEYMTSTTTTIAPESNLPNIITIDDDVKFFDKRVYNTDYKDRYLFGGMELEITNFRGIVASVDFKLAFDIYRNNNNDELVSRVVRNARLEFTGGTVEFEVETENGKYQNFLKDEQLSVYIGVIKTVVSDDKITISLASSFIEDRDPNTNPTENVLVGSTIYKPNDNFRPYYLAVKCLQLSSIGLKDSTPSIVFSSKDLDIRDNTYNLFNNYRTISNEKEKKGVWTTSITI